MAKKNKRKRVEQEDDAGSDGPETMNGVAMPRVLSIQLQIRHSS